MTPIILEAAGPKVEPLREGDQSLRLVPGMNMVGERAAVTINLRTLLSRDPWMLGIVRTDLTSGNRNMTGILIRLIELFTT